MLPQSFMDRYAEPEDKMFMFGRPVESLSREELLACVYYLSGEGRRVEAESKRRIEMFRAFAKAGVALYYRPMPQRFLTSEDEPWM